MITPRHIIAGEMMVNCNLNAPFSIQINETAGQYDSHNIYDLRLSNFNFIIRGTMGGAGNSIIGYVQLYDIGWQEFFNYLTIGTISSGDTDVNHEIQFDYPLGIWRIRTDLTNNLIVGDKISVLVYGKAR